jgi:hypothetical protein
MSFQKGIRKIHLIASMIMLSFMLVYLITGVFMINHDLFSLPEIRVSHSRIPVEKPMQGEAKEYATYLKETFDLKGRTEYRKDNRDNWIFHFNTPGEAYQIKLPPSQDTLYLQKSTQDKTFYMVAHRIHILRGFKGGWEYTAWAVMYDTSCFAMILFAITGIILWYRRRKQYRHGWWYLLAGLLVPFLFICAFVFWK